MMTHLFLQALEADKIITDKNGVKIYFLTSVNPKRYRCLDLDNASFQDLVHDGFRSVRDAVFLRTDDGITQEEYHNYE